MELDLLLIWPIIRHALLYGGILSGVILILLLGITLWNPEIMLKDYPPDIQAKFGSMSERAKRQKKPVSILFFVVLFSVIALSLKGIITITGGDITFLIAFIHLFIMFTLFNVFDLLVLDWLIVVKLQPKFMVLPGTERMAGYSDYWFHFKGFLIGIVITFISSILIGGIVAIFF